MMYYTNWSEFEPIYQALLDEVLAVDDVRPWLSRWSDIEKHFNEVKSRLTAKKDANPSDLQSSQAFSEFMQTVVPQVTKVNQKLRSKLLSIQDWHPPQDCTRLVRHFTLRSKLYHADNAALELEVSELNLAFDKIVSSLRVNWNGQKVSLPKAHQLLSNLQRTEREELWKSIILARLDVAPQIDDIFLKLLSLRRKIAKNAGFDRPLDYFWTLKERTDYTENDARKLHSAIVSHVLPLKAKMYSKKAQKMGLAALRPWDLQVDSLDRPALKPFEGHLELEETAQRIFDALDSEWGRQFAQMREGGHLDLESGPNKIPGLGYCTFLPITKQPFIYWTSFGMDVDVRVLMHEVGHAFHFLASDKSNDLTWNLFSPMEFAEVASQGMELLTLHLLEKPVGFYSKDDAQRSRHAKLMTVLRQFTDLSPDDLFQLWLYGEAPEDVTAEDLDAKWLEYASRSDAGVDMSGLEWTVAKGWQTVGHFFSHPMYMFEYIVAWMGALQLWQNAQRDQPKAIADLKYAMSLGKTRPLPELFEAAGIQFSFEGDVLAKLMDFIEAQLDVQA